MSMLRDKKAIQYIKWYSYRCVLLIDITNLGVVLLENRAIVVSFFRHGCVLREAEGGVLEHEIRDVLVSVVSQRINPTVAHSIRELCIREQKV